MGPHLLVPWIPFLKYEAATRCSPLQVTYLDLPGKGCQVCLSKLPGVSLQHGFLGFFKERTPWSEGASSNDFCSRCLTHLSKTSQHFNFTQPLGKKVNVFTTGLSSHPNFCGPFLGPNCLRRLEIQGFQIIKKLSPQSTSWSSMIGQPPHP